MGLTPDYRWKVKRVLQQYSALLTDYREMKVAFHDQLVDELKFSGCDILMESRVPKEVRDQLTAMGHEIKVTGDFSNQMGGGQAVIHNSATKVNYGASDPRKDGAAVPELVARRP